ncbi:MAG: hypothetical protein FIB01_06010 [Gemmatimonadetes bacterium]|nr:hypothetical protein [Gemmatimonadota bacterium]
MRRPLLVLVLLAGHAAAARAQERRVAVPVDYIAGADIYVALGARAGLVQGDTIPVFADSLGTRRGTLVARVVALRRAVLTYTEPRFPVTVGDTLWLGLLHPPPVDGTLVLPAARPADSAGARPAAGPRAASRARPARLAGQLALDLDAVRTDAFEGGSRRYTTPTLRLQAVAADLPGGVRFVTNVRASRLGSSFPGSEPVTSVRVYQATLEKTFTAVPLRLQAGRFAPPLQPYGGYWDGVLARVGGPGFGIGAAAGFLPNRADESFSATVPRVSAFADYHAGRGPLRYDAELGFNALRPRARYSDQTFIGLSQRLRWGGMWLSQALQADRNADASWTLSVLQLNALVPLASGLLLRAAGGRHRAAELDGIVPLPTYYRDRGSVGLSYYDAGLSLSGDVSVARRADGSTTRAYTASLQLPRVLAGTGLGGSATFTDNETYRAAYLAGELWRNFGRAYARASVRTTGYDGLLAAHRGNGADLTVTVPLAARAQASVRLETSWGDAGGARQRILTSIATGF